ncbi:MAG: DUF1349 domain-containing protein [Leptolinea sp.]|jgi:regulation of enolase protein 1 (concanavalin A-like superfamily)|nr:DUF1349 domain-containing protein [Leptolinea sp.]
MNIDFSKFYWLNRPTHHEIKKDAVIITTDPLTDFWQRTYYGFRHDTAHAFLFSVGEEEFSFTVKAVWQPQKLFDQCGVILYQDADNWFKASVEYDNPEFSRLGSVVTNLGYSDWATTDIDSSHHAMFYRLSRRGQDFLIENSFDGGQFRQMRIFHMHQPVSQVNIGIYACSPLNSSMDAEFSRFSIGECQWELYVEPEG